MVNIPERRDARGRRPTYFWDHYFFDRIDCEDKAYWLGFLAGRGAVTSRGQLIVYLRPRNEAQLYAFVKALSSNYVVKRQERGTYSVSRIVVQSPQIAAALTAFGIGRRRSGPASWPTSLPRPLRRHFVRGLCDACGGFFVYRQHGVARAQLAVTAGENMLRGVSNYFETELGNVSASITPIRGSYRLSVCRRDSVEAVAALLYRNATVYLQPKWDRLRQFLIGSADPRR